MKLLREGEVAERERDANGSVEKSKCVCVTLVAGGCEIWGASVRFK